MTDYVNPLRQLRSEMDRVLTGFLSGGVDGAVSPLQRGRPAMNLWDEGASLKLEMELPGIKSEQIDISVAGNELTVKVTRPEIEEEQTTYLRCERSTGSFSRRIELPQEVNADEVQAELCDGLLRVSLLKAESAKPRKIEVKTSSSSTGSSGTGRPSIAPVE